MTPYLQLRGVRKQFGEFVALHEVDLDVAQGELLCLLGPSGCGKTTLLRIVAGLERQTAGQIVQAGRDVSRLPPADRDFGIVFQSYALFPNLTAARNIAYGLRSTGARRSEVERRVQELLELVGLPEAGPRYPAQLSGGQQQRVALARALALSPGLLLLDEPLSALDARVRATLRLELRSLQRRLGITTILVTHDQEEALAMADRIVVMDHGRIAQIGTPLEVYTRPATAFVAGFVGEMNFLPGRLVGRPGETVAVRPEDVRVLEAEPAAPGALRARIEETAFLGPAWRLLLRLTAEPQVLLRADVPAAAARARVLQPTMEVPIELPAGQLLAYAGGEG